MPFDALAGSLSPAEQALDDAIGYYETEMGGALSDWRELAAVYARGPTLRIFPSR
jgi:hypothetical protein